LRRDPIKPSITSRCVQRLCTTASTTGATVEEMRVTQRKKALVTGGATGIGRSAVLALARAGYDVAINYASSARAAAGRRRSAGARRADNAAAMRRQRRRRGARDARQGRREFGRLDALVNNAGTTAEWKVKDLDSLDMDEWDRTFAVNVRGNFQVTRAAVPLLKKGETPAIVNTASIVGLRPGPQPPPYAASKAAVVNLTKTMAWNLGPADPRQRGRARLDGRRLDGTHARRQVRRPDGQARQATPLRRCVTADDVAESMLSLIESNRFVTGEIVVIDGGFTSST
jgi:3-oxoacyl-[acyl-carrier protein] reductase